MPAQKPPASEVTGVIVRVHRLGCVVEHERIHYECKRKKDADLCVGDEVHMTPQVDGRGRIRERIERRSWYARGVDGGRRTKLVAANAEVLAVVVSTAQPPLQPALIDRFLVLAGVGHMRPMVCLNKSDLPEAEEASAVLAPYAALGIATFRLVATTGEGVDRLRTAIQNTRALFCGVSGVGKSTLINGMVGDGERVRTGEVSSATGKGTHTTTWVDWIRLDADTVVIDTPGIRQLSLAMLARRDLQAGFPEFADYVRDCEFADCLHSRERECAVQAAAERGDIPRTRYARYRAIVENP